MSLKLTDTMIKAAMFLGDNGEAELSRELFAEIERLLADEWEKVREMCAVVADEFPYSVHGTKKGTRKQECITNQHIADAIRQLDLTKDLAASSREKGGDA